jgi:hypothetical protein
MAAGGPGRRSRRAQSPTTRAHYMRALSLFLDMCERDGHNPDRADGGTMRAFVSLLTQRPVEKGKNRGRTGWAPASIVQALSAVRTYYDLIGVNPPSLTLAGDLLDDYEAGRAADPTTTDGQGAPGLRLPTLDAMFEALPVDTTAGLRDRALLSLGWAMMAPRILLSDLDIDHVTDTDTGLEVTVYRDLVTSRILTEPRTVTIPRMPHLGVLCPVANTVAWRRRLATLGITDGPLLRSVDKWDRPAGVVGHAGPPSVGHRMDPPTVDLVVTRAATRAAIPDGAELTAQSLRRGGVEDAYAGGADVPVISRHAGYGDRSTMVFRHIGDAIRERGNPLDGITYEPATDQP